MGGLRFRRTTSKICLKIDSSQTLSGMSARSSLLLTKKRGSARPRNTSASTRNPLSPEAGVTAPGESAGETSDLVVSAATPARGDTSTGMNPSTTLVVMSIHPWCQEDRCSVTTTMFLPCYPFPRLRRGEADLWFAISVRAKVTKPTCALLRTTNECFIYSMWLVSLYIVTHC